MNILVSSNKKYLKPLSVMLYSLSKNTNEEINAYFLNVSLDNKEIDKFQKNIDKIKNIKLNIIQLNIQDFEGLPIVAHISIETYARLFLLKVLPREMERILWLDADIVVNHNIDEFYNEEFDNKYAVVAQSINKEPEKLLQNLNLDISQKYFNAGVILFNLKLLREEKNEEVFLDYAKINFEKLKWLDQDVLNATIGYNCKFVDYKLYNMMHFTGFNFSDEEFKFIKNNSVILHYLGAIKPWNYEFVGKTKKIWLKWAKKSHAYSVWFFIKYFSLFNLRQLKRFCTKKTKNFVKRLRNVLYKIKCKKVNILTTDQTINYIIENKSSVCRFGDGEMFIIDNELDIGFQQKDEKLSEHLLKVLKEKSTNDNLICIPRWIFKKEDLAKRTQKSQKWCKNYLLSRFPNWCKKIDLSTFYGDTSFNRNYIGLKNKNEAIEIFNKLKMIWKGRDVCFIEGDKTYLGVGNDLFDNAKSIKRIIAPSKSAYSRFDKIINAAKKVNKDILFLVALGPTATVLCYELSKLGYQAIDIGHIDVEYEWCKMGAKDVVQLKNKFTNEAGSQNNIESMKDEVYESQIIAKIE